MIVEIPLTEVATRRRIVAQGKSVIVISTDGDFYVADEPSGDMVLLQARGDRLDFCDNRHEFYYSVVTPVADGVARLLVSDRVGAYFSPLA